MNTTIESYRAKVETMERDAETVLDVDREILATCAGRLADELDGAAWTCEGARAEGTSIAARARRVERDLTAKIQA